MKLLSRISLIFAAVLFVGAGSAKADTMLFFSITGPTTATFELPTHPTINPYNADSEVGFLITPINLMVDGVASDDFMGFYLGGKYGGALGIFSSTISYDMYLTGVQLFSGTPLYPVFAAHGPIILSDPGTRDHAYTLTISQNPPSVPEPSTMLLLAAGLLPLGLLAKRLL
jgi:PEP-CTERM motif